MRTYSTIFCLIITILFSNNIVGQGPYYTNVDLNLQGLELRDELATHVISTHNDFLSYAEVYQLLKITDLVPGNNNLVQLLYGYNDTDELFINDLTRDKEQTGNEIGSWNREHVYAKSLGTPSFSNSGPGSDAHAIRSCDLQMNSTRNNRKFASGSGFAGVVGSDFYPGDQWKGDCARMMMYMYLRYGSQCLPNNVGVGAANSVDASMIELFLDWNAEDPVSAYEIVRNDVLESEQGNRNPFIDNPALATIIWGGAIAEDPWGLLSAPTVSLSIKVYLEGPYNSIDGLMTDQLRLNTTLPIDEPYTALGFTVLSGPLTSTLHAVVGPNAPVDWVLLEIRSGASPTTVIDSKAVILQRDGDLVMPNGDDIMLNTNLASDIYIAVRHRNHFGIRTTNTFTLDANITIDFTDPITAVFGLNSRKINNGSAFLYAGDANSDNTINAIDKNVYWRNQNGGSFDYLLHSADFNIDGAVNVIDKNLYWRSNNGTDGTLD